MVRYYGPQERFDGRLLDDDPHLVDEIRIFEDDDNDPLEDDAEDLGLDLGRQKNRWRDYAYEDYYGLT